MSIRDILRHHHDLGLPRAEIAVAVSGSAGTVSNVLERAQAAGLSWPLPSVLDDAGLRAQLYPVAPRESGYAHAGFGPSVSGAPGFTLRRRPQGQFQLDILPLGSHERAVLLALSIVQAYAGEPATMPSADFCTAITALRNRSVRGFRTRRRPPEVRPTAFTAHPPDLPPRPLMALDFAIIGPLVRPGRPRIRLLSIGSRLCSTLPSDTASRRRPCASLILRRHRAG